MAQTGNARRRPLSSTATDQYRPAHAGEIQPTLPFESTSKEVQERRTYHSELLKQIEAELLALPDGALAGLDLEEIAKRMVTVVPVHAQSKWDNIIGPFYTTPSLAKAKSITRQALQKQRDRRTILATPAGDGANLYPSFQFGDDLTLLPYLREVSEMLGKVIRDPWTLAHWLVSPRPELDDRIPYVLLRGDDDEVQRVLELADDDAQIRSADVLVT